MEVGYRLKASAAFVLRTFGKREHLYRLNGMLGETQRHSWRFGREKIS
jgi:hypothetical protein